MSVIALLLLVTPIPAALVLAALTPRLRLLALLAWWSVLPVLIVGAVGWGMVLSPATVVSAHVLVLLGGAALWWRQATTRRDWAAWWQRQRSLWHTLAPAEQHAWRIAALLGTVVTVVSVSVPTPNYDTLMYQWPVVAEWFANGGLRPPLRPWIEATAHNAGISTYPYGWNAWYALVMAVDGRMRGGMLPNLLAAGLLMVATGVLARLAGARPPAARLAALAAALLPLTVNATHAAQVDLALGAWVTAGLAAVVMGARHRHGPTLALAVACAAMMAATKFSGAVFAVLTVVVGLAALPGRRWSLGRHAGWGGLLTTATLALLTVAAGLAWYLHAWQLTGNPLGVMAFAHFPGVLDRAFIARTTLIGVFSPANGHHWLLVLGALLAYVGLPAVLASWGWLRGWNVSRRLRLMLAATTLVLIGLWLNQPWSAKHAHEADLSWWFGQQQRYCLVWWPLALAVAAVGWHRAPQRTANLGAPISNRLENCVRQHATSRSLRCPGPAPGRWLPWLTGIAALHALLMLEVWWWQPWAMLGLVLVVAPVALLALRGRRSALSAVGAAALLGMLWLNPWLERRGFGGIAAAVAELPPGSRIAAVGSELPWLVPGATPLPVPATATAMLASLAASGCTHVALGPAPGPAPVFDWFYTWQRCGTGTALRLVHVSGDGDDLGQQIVLYRLDRDGR